MTFSLQSTKTYLLIIAFQVIFSVLSLFLYIPSLLFSLCKNPLLHFLITRHRSPIITNPSPSQRIAVIGGGIAGTTSAFILKKLGFTVEIFERKGCLGGNATTVDWEVTVPISPLINQQPTELQRTLVRVGTSVLAYPTKYFRNYILLLKKLGVSTTTVQLPFTVGVESSTTRLDDTCNSKTPIRTTSYFQNDNHSSELYQKYGSDIARWLDLISLIRAVNDIAHGTTESSPTVYAAGLLNPFNYISLYTAMRCYGISRQFYHEIFVAVYSSSFLTADLYALPARIAPVIHDIIPLDAAAELDTWKEDSSIVFKKMIKDIDFIHLNAEIIKVDTSNVLPAGQKQLGTISSVSVKNKIAVHYGIINDDILVRDKYVNTSVLHADPEAPSFEMIPTLTTTASTSEEPPVDCNFTLEREAATNQRQFNPSLLDDEYMRERRQFSLLQINNQHPPNGGKRNVGSDENVMKKGEKCPKNEHGVEKSSLHVGGTRYFDRVIFACNNEAILNMLYPVNHLQKLLLSQIEWCDTTDNTFTYGVIHSDKNILPPQISHELLDKYSNYIHVINNTAVNQNNTTNDPSPSANNASNHSHTPNNVTVTPVSHVSHSTSPPPSLGKRHHQHQQYTPLPPTPFSAIPYLLFSEQTAMAICTDIYFVTITQFIMVIYVSIISLFKMIIIPLLCSKICNTYGHDDSGSDGESRVLDTSNINLNQWTYENTFILSSWVPKVNSLYNSATNYLKRPMMISYNLHNTRHNDISPRKVHAVGNITNIKAHPAFNLWNLLMSQLLRTIQGRNGCYYSSSFTTTCTGHDLSLLSGLVAASYIVGDDAIEKAFYNEDDITNEIKNNDTAAHDVTGALKDFKYMKQNIMGQ